MGLGADGRWDTDWLETPRAVHLYGEPGRYTVRLQVQDADGRRDLTTATVDVGDGPEGWDFHLIDADGDAGRWSSIALDSRGNVHIAYNERAVGGLRHATNAGGEWEITLVDGQPGAGRGASLALDANDAAHICYENDVEKIVRYATNVSGVWVRETITPRGVNASSGESCIALDGAGAVHTAYFDGANLRLLYATNASGTWRTEVVHDISRWNLRLPEIALDAGGAVHLTYDDNRFTTPDIRYATNASGNWVSEVVDAGMSGVFNVEGNSGLILDGNGVPHVVYHHAGDQDLKHATLQGGAWVITSLGVNGIPYGAPALIVDNTGTLYAAFLELDTEEIGIASRPAGGDWTIEVVDTTAGVSVHTSLAIDAQGRLHLSYYDTVHDALKYAVQW